MRLGFLRIHPCQWRPDGQQLNSNPSRDLLHKCCGYQCGPGCACITRHLYNFLAHPCFGWDGFRSRTLPDHHYSSAANEHPKCYSHTNSNHRPLSVQQYSETVSIPGGGTENKTVTCPAGSVVVSGGFATSVDVRVWHQTKDGNGWRVYATNTNAANRQIIFTRTACIIRGEQQM